jgi:hypothetical protein
MAVGGGLMAVLALVLPVAAAFTDRTRRTD